MPKSVSNVAPVGLEEVKEVSMESSLLDQQDPIPQPIQGASLSAANSGPSTSLESSLPVSDSHIIENHMVNEDSSNTFEEELDKMNTEIARLISRRDRFLS